MDASEIEFALLLFSLVAVVVLVYLAWLCDSTDWERYFPD